MELFFILLRELVPYTHYQRVYTIYRMSILQQTFGVFIHVLALMVDYVIIYSS